MTIPWFRGARSEAGCAKRRAPPNAWLKKHFYNLRVEKGYNICGRLQGGTRIEQFDSRREIARTI